MHRVVEQVVVARLGQPGPRVLSRVPFWTGTAVLLTTGLLGCHHRGMTPTARLVAAGPVLVLAACLALSAAAVTLDVLNAPTVLPQESYPAWTSVLAGLALAVPGCLLLRRIGSHPVGWVMAAGGLLWCVDAVAAGWWQYALYTSPGAPLATPAYFFGARVGAVLMLPVPLMLLLFPDGRFPTGRLCWPARLTVAWVALLPVVLLLAPTSALVRFDGQPLDPVVRGLDLDLLSVPLPYGVWHVLLTVAMAATVAGLLVPVLVLVARYRGADAERRAQLRWLLLAAVVAAGVLVVGRFGPDGLGGFLLPMSVAAVSCAVVVAVTRYRLYDVDLLLGWTLLYGGLAASVVAVDVAVFALAGSLVSTRESALVAVAVVGILYGPLRVRLQQAVQRLVRGRRDDPWAVVSALAERLEDSSDADAQLLAVARSVATAFRTRYVRVELERGDGGLVVAEHGTPVERTVDLPVTYRGDPIGRLVLAPPSGLRLSVADQRLLGDVVRQAAAAHRAALLAEELQASRLALVTAREEERRRLRRDLHDGLGPALGALSLRIETARNVYPSAPDRADALLASTVQDVAGVLADVRRLVHGLRPPALDEVGLLGALEQQASRLRRSEGGQPLDVQVEATGELAGLPAAVEVAAYRIVSEALANVVRHAGASRVTVRLQAGMALEIEVRDDGVGIPLQTPAGVGLVSLRERAAELGGEVSVGCPDVRGTVVRARLPLHAPVPAQTRPPHA